MRKRQLLPVFLLILALLLSACGGGSAAPAEAPADAAEASVEAPAEPVEEGFAPNLPDEDYAAMPYTLYPIPEGGYVGDTMPFVTEDGTLELYYLYDTDHNGQGYHPFYMYSTPNFYDYTDHGMVLNYGTMSDPDPALGTGCIMQDQDGLYHLFYTGHNDTGNGGKGMECVMVATSTDRVNWEKNPEPLLFAPENYDKDNFRDPEVFWVEDDGCYWMLIAAHEQSMGGVVAKFTSEDLVNWEFSGPFFAPHAQFILECPDLFRIGDTWYLTYSWDCVTYYAIGDSMDGPFVPARDNILDGKGTMEGSGFVFYAAKTAEIGDEVYLCGWLGRAGVSGDSGIYQWAGNAMNHQLVQLEDGKLGVKAPESLEEYFVADKPFEAVGRKGQVEISGNSITLSGGDGGYALADMGTRPVTMTLECDVSFDGGRVGFAFGGSEADEAWTALCLDAGRNLLHYEGYELAELDDYPPMAVTRFDFSKSPVHHVTLVCENEIVVMYIDDEKALSSRIGHSIDGAHIGVFAENCDATFSGTRQR